MTDIDALIADAENARRGPVSSILIDDLIAALRELRDENARLIADDDAGIARLAARLGAGKNWTANYSFDKTDTHTRLFCAASDWMDRAGRAEAERDALRADAERYLWLRQSTLEEAMTVIDLRGKWLDAAIDAVRAALDRP